MQMFAYIIHLHFCETSTVIKPLDTQEDECQGIEGESGQLLLLRSEAFLWNTAGSGVTPERGGGDAMP